MLAFNSDIYGPKDLSERSHEHHVWLCDWLRRPRRHALAELQSASLDVQSTADGHGAIIALILAAAVTKMHRRVGHVHGRFLRIHRRQLNHGTRMITPTSGVHR